METQKGLWPGKRCPELLRREMRDSCKGYGEGGDFKLTQTLVKGRNFAKGLILSESD